MQLHLCIFDYCKNPSAFSPDLGSANVLLVLKLTVEMNCLFLPPTHRESIYQILSQTTPENTSKNYADYSINPRTRYTRVNLTSITTSQVRRNVIFYVPNTPLNLILIFVTYVVQSCRSRYIEIVFLRLFVFYKKKTFGKKRLFLDFFAFMKVQHLYDVDKSNQASRKLKNRLTPTHQGTYLPSPFLLSWVEQARGGKENAQKSASKVDGCIFFS